MAIVLATIELTGLGAHGAPMAEAVYAHPALRAVMERLAQEKPTTVAFFGGSITWGATATDPLRTSWRALVERELRRRHPRTPMTAVDAAIGGQTSKLGVFRMDRDVLPYKPDLCFVEFAVNDWGAPDSAESIEGIVRKLRTCRADMTIVLVLIGSNAAYDRSPSQAGQLALAEYYGLPVIDIYAAVKARLANGLTTRDILTDGCHPNDRGYRLYADIILAELGRLSDARGPAKPVPDKPLTPNRYESAMMIELAKLPDLGGWRADNPSVVGTWFDQQPSRWLSSAVVPGKDGAALTVEVQSTGLGLYYELTGGGGPVVLAADGKTVLEIKTDHKFAFQRVGYSFTLLGGPAQKRKVTLTAPQAANTKAAYVLYTR